MIAHLFRVFSKFWQHPFTKNAPITAVRRYIGFQLSSRFLPYPIIVPYVGNCKQIIRRHSHCGTGNYYFGLSEFEEMSFLLHFLREDDLFVDIGANIGSYSLLASGVIGAHSIALEPVQETFRILLENIGINNLQNKITAMPIAIAADKQVIFLTADRGIQNHVVAGKNSGGQQAEAITLDEILLGKAPILLKIDVEGFETEVLRGATHTLANPSLKAIIIETEGLGQRYGFEEDIVHQMILEAGFCRWRYLPFERKLYSSTSVWKGNNLYLREEDFIRDRVKKAKEFEVLGTII